MRMSRMDRATGLRLLDALRIEADGERLKILDADMHFGVDERSTATIKFYLEEKQLRRLNLLTDDDVE